MPGCILFWLAWWRLSFDLQNLLYVRNVETPNRFGGVEYLGFDKLTYVPIQVCYWLLVTRHDISLFIAAHSILNDRLYYISWRPEVLLSVFIDSSQLLLNFWMFYLSHVFIHTTVTNLGNILQIKLVDLSLLSVAEIDWLNNYHSQVWEKVFCFGFFWVHLACLLICCMASLFLLVLLLILLWSLSPFFYINAFSLERALALVWEENSSF